MGMHSEIHRNRTGTHGMHSEIHWQGIGTHGNAVLNPLEGNRNLNSWDAVLRFTPLA